MRKKIWIWNHYATHMFKEQGGRHFWFGENLIKQGYSPIIFCASTIHNSNNFIDTGKKKYITKNANGIPFVFVKTPTYKGNGIDRIKNMISFYRNLFPVAKDYAKRYGKPDVILASSVHPLTLVAGIKVAKKFGVPIICEVRDLWPETLVEYGTLNRNSFLTKLLYLGEKWIYKKADRLIFTMEGGKDYIIDKKWDKERGGPIDLNKIHHINNGVDLNTFNQNKIQYKIDDKDLDNDDFFKVVYTGSIRKANNVKKIVDVAKLIEKEGVRNIKFLIFGDGTERLELERYCERNNLQNILFKGFVEKKYIPYILSKSDLNIMHFQQNNLKKYGASLNKMFEYFASGKPIISDCLFGYDLIKRYNCGITIDNATSEQLANAIIEISKMPKEYDLFCKNSINAAKDYDFKILSIKLINIIKNI